MCCAAASTRRTSSSCSSSLAPSGSRHGSPRLCAVLRLLPPVALCTCPGQFWSEAEAGGHLPSTILWGPHSDMCMGCNLRCLKGPVTIYVDIQMAMP